MTTGSALRDSRDRSRRYWLAMLAVIIAAGILSRSLHTGFILLDKYLGDTLYAAMVYVLLRLTGRINRVALWSAIVMLAIELFQLTGIPASMVQETNPLAVRIAGRLLGTHFSILDLLAYALGIVCIAWWHHLPPVISPTRSNPNKD